MPFLGAIIPALAPAFAAGGIFAAGTIGAFALQLGGSLLLSAAAKALQKKPKAEIQGRTVTTREAVAPREIVYGRTRKGGTIVYMAVRGEKSEYLDVVIALAGHRVKNIGAVYLDGELAIPNGSIFPVGRWADGKLGIERRLGDDNQAALTVLQGLYPGVWTASHRLRGVAHVWISMVYDPDVYPSGIPNITFDIEGKDDILDPRTGTRGYTENPALCLADYMSLTRFGLNAQIGAADGINQADLIASANVCDESVPKVGGGVENRYTCNGVVSLAQTPKANIEDMLTAMAGTVAYAGGQWSIYAGYYRTPSVTLTADDVRAGGLSVATRASMSENFNAVRGTFVSPENDWQPDDFPAYESATYLAEDNGERTYRDITLPFTISASMAQRLAKIELERQRRQQTVQLAGKLTAWKVGVGDVVNLTYDRWGWSAKPYDVAGLSLDIGGDEGAPSILPTLTLRETSPLVYEWNVSEAQIYAAAPRTTLPSAFDVVAPGTPSAAESLYQTVDGAGVKVKVSLSWPASPSVFADQYQVESRLQGATVWTVQGRTGETTFDLLDWNPGNWQFRVKVLNRAGVSSGYATTQIVQVAGLGAPPADLAGATIQTAGGLAILKWTLAADLDVRVGGTIVIRHSAALSPSWSNSVAMDIVPGNTAQSVVPLKPGAYLLRARDQAGNLSPNAVVLLADGAQAVPFISAGSLVEDTTFTGTKTNCVVNTGTLQMTSSSQFDSWASVDAVLNVDAEGGIVPLATYDFAAGLNFGLVKKVRIRSVIALDVISIADPVDTRPGDIDSWISFDGIEGGECDVRVEIQTTQTNPSGSPIWSTWQRAENTEVQAWGIRARAILTSADANFTPAVSQLRLFADEVV